MADNVMTSIKMTNTGSQPGILFTGAGSSYSGSMGKHWRALGGLQAFLLHVSKAPAVPFDWNPSRQVNCMM